MTATVPMTSPISRETRFRTQHRTRSTLSRTVSSRIRTVKTSSLPNWNVTVQTETTPTVESTPSACAAFLRNPLSSRVTGSLTPSLSWKCACMKCAVRTTLITLGACVTPSLFTRESARGITTRPLRGGSSSVVSRELNQLLTPASQSASRRSISQSISQSVR